MPRPWIMVTHRQTKGCLSKPSFTFFSSVHHRLATPKKVTCTSTHPVHHSFQFPKWEPHSPTHRAVAHAGGRRQCLLQGVAFLQCTWLGCSCRPLTGQQVLQNVTVAPQCAVDQCTLTFLIQMVQLEGRSKGHHLASSLL